MYEGELHLRRANQIFHQPVFHVSLICNSVCDDRFTQIIFQRFSWVLENQAIPGVSLPMLFCHEYIFISQKDNIPLGINFALIAVLFLVLYHFS